MKKKLTLLLAMVSTIAIIHAQWALSGNSIASGDFLGTTNSQPLVFKVNSSQSGLIDHIAKNTMLGYQALLSNTTGGGNTGMGYLTLYSNTSGSNNIAHGQISLYNNTTGSYNIGLGSSALWANTSGSQNVAIGFGALDGNTTANYNVASGYKTLFNNTTGTGNSAYGHQALYSNTTTSYLTAIGYQALYSNTSGEFNTATGYQSLYSNTSGNENTAVGYHALYSNTTGGHNTAYGPSALQNNTTGEYNIAIGDFALGSNTIGWSNIAIGGSALYSNTSDANIAVGGTALLWNTTGERNVAVGWGALSSNTTGIWNVGLGYGALTNSTGSSNTAVGYYANVFGGAYSNSTALGSFAAATGSDMVRVGNSFVTSIGGYADWTNISDKRVKKNIQANVPGLVFINKLKPVTYNLDLDAIDKIIQRPAIKTPDGKIKQSSQEELVARKQKEQIIYTGFVAQDVEKAAKELNYDFSGVDAPKNDKDVYGLRYAEFVVPLVKAVQELSTENNSLKEENKQLEAQLNELDKRITALELILKQQDGFKVTPSQSEIINDVARLEQNAPNPFNNTTIIRYYIPENSSSAQIIVTDLNAHILKNISIGSKGEGQITIKAGTLAAGNYIYSLVVDGRKVDNKQMVLTR